MGKNKYIHPDQVSGENLNGLNGANQGDRGSKNRRQKQKKQRYVLPETMQTPPAGENVEAAFTTEEISSSRPVSEPEQTNFESVSPAQNQPVYPHAQQHAAYRYKAPRTKKAAIKKNKIIVSVSVVLSLVIVGLTLWFLVFKKMLIANTSPAVYVESVGVITGAMSSNSHRYMGVVEPQKTVKVEKDPDKPLAQILVTVGQEVNVGDTLFTYNTEEMTLTLSQANLDLEKINDEIATLKSQISALQTDISKATGDDKATYTIRMQSLEFTVKEREHAASSKRLEIDKLNESIANAEFKSEAAGVIREINRNNETDASGQPKPFIAILTTGDYRVKGTISEQTAKTLSPGQAVTIRSRIDNQQTWEGVIDTIDYDNPITSSQAMYAGPGQDSTTPASKYHFYITLNTHDGLFLGQHIYIEPFVEKTDVKEGLWLPSVYLIIENETDAYVWARDASDLLEKRKVTLGQHDAEQDQHEIVSGLTARDYIAVPKDTYKAGMPTTRSNSQLGSESGTESDLLGGIDTGDPNVGIPIESLPGIEEGDGNPVFEGNEGEDGIGSQAPFPEMPTGESGVNLP